MVATVVAQGPAIMASHGYTDRKLTCTEERLCSERRSCVRNKGLLDDSGAGWYCAYNRNRNRDA